VPLLWRIFVGNAIVLGVATLALVLTPVTVSFPAAERELLVLAGGFAVMLVVNYVLLRRAVTPLRRLASVMREVDPLAPGRRARLPGAPAEVAELGAAFDQMLERLEQERRDSARRALGAQEGERLRIARELHDEVGQALTAVLLQLDRAQAGIDGESGERIREARETARETLEEALSEYEGTLLVISHDRYFLDRVCTKLLVIEGKRLEAHLGNYSDWRARQSE